MRVLHTNIIIHACYSRITSKDRQYIEFDVNSELNFCLLHVIKFFLCEPPGICSTNLYMRPIYYLLQICRILSSDQTLRQCWKLDPLLKLMFEYIKHNSFLFCAFQVSTNWFIPLHERITFIWWYSCEFWEFYPLLEPV
jgi:hypothetical protein